LLRNRLEELDALLVGFNIEVIIVTFFLDSVETLFEAVLPMRDKP